MNRLSTLNASTRISMLWLAPSPKSPDTATSAFQNAGPSRLVRRCVPKTPGAGWANASDRRLCNIQATGQRLFKGNLPADY